MRLKQRLQRLEAKHVRAPCRGCGGGAIVVLRDPGDQPVPPCALCGGAPRVIKVVETVVTTPACTSGQAYSDYKT